MDKRKSKKHCRKNGDIPKGIPKRLRQHVRDLLKWADIDDALLLSDRTTELAEARDRAERREKQGLTYIV